MAAVLAGCDEIPGGTGSSPSNPPNPPPIERWDCTFNAGSCFCTPGVGNGAPSCPTDLGCCLLRKDEVLGTTCQCSPTDEIGCQNLLAADATASLVTTCPP